MQCGFCVSSAFVIKTAIAIISMVAALFAIHLYVDWWMEQKIYGDEFVKKVAENLRPFMIFDEKENVLYDKGAGKYITNFQVHIKKDGEPGRITITPKEHLAYSPILESLDARFVITESRGHKNAWVYELKPISAILDQSSAIVTRWRFRLEIVR